MNKHTSQILRLGVVFTALVAFIDVFLTQLPILDWLALSIVFLLLATVTLDSVMPLVPKQMHHAQSVSERRDELDNFEEIIKRAVSKNDHEAIEMLVGKLRLIVAGAIATESNLSTREILEQAENGSDSIRSIVRDEQMLKLLAGNPSVLGTGTHREIERFLTKVEAWSS